MDKDFFFDTDYVSNRNYNFTYQKEYDNDIDRLRDELFSYTQEIEDNEKAIKFLHADIAEMKARLIKKRKLLIKTYATLAFVAVGCSVYSINIFEVSSLKGAKDLVEIIVLLPFFILFSYRELHHVKPGIFKKIPYLIKEESLTYQLEDKKEEIELYKRSILESKERIKQLREEIAVLEAKDN